jgi:hypothetical protein
MTGNTHATPASVAIRTAASMAGPLMTAKTAQSIHNHGDSRIIDILDGRLRDIAGSVEQLDSLTDSAAEDAHEVVGGICWQSNGLSNDADVCDLKAAHDLRPSGR